MKYFLQIFRWHVQWLARCAVIALEDQTQLLSYMLFISLWSVEFFFITRINQHSDDHNQNKNHQHGVYRLSIDWCRSIVCWVELEQNYLLQDPTFFAGLCPMHDWWRISWRMNSILEKNIKIDKGSGTPLVRLYKDNALILGHLPQSAHLTNFENLATMLTFRFTYAASAL